MPSSEPTLGDDWNSPGRDIDVDGVRLHVSESGEGRPLLLVMGIGGHVGMWRPFVRRLVPFGIRAISYDHPGTGESTNYRRPRRMAGVARTIEQMLDELGYDEVDVLGVSFGGGVAQQLAHQIPDRVRRLVLCATSAGMVSVPGSPKAMLALATPRRFTDPDYYKKIAPTVFGGKARNDPKAVEHAQDRFAIPPSARGYGQQMLAAAGWTSYRWLSSLTQRTLVLHGDDDPIVPLANGQLLARRIPGATLQVIPGGGHLFLLDQIDEVIPEIVSFLGEEEIPVEGTW